MSEVRDGLMGRRPAPPEERIRIDDHPAALATAIKLEFRRKEFVRARANKATDPEPELSISIINAFLTRLRVLTQAEWISLLNPKNTTWALEYLNDDGSDLPDDPSQIRHAVILAGTTRLFGISRLRWDLLAPLDLQFEPLVWDELLLDAQALLPRVGPALVLAYSAVETFAEQLCSKLVTSTGIPVDLWSWIVDRGDYRKDPSTAEFLDVLLKVGSGKSLKLDAPDIWEAFVHLREARNSYVHGGRARDKKGTVVTLDEARQLVAKAKDIISWLETLAPSELRRSTETTTTVEATVRFR